MTSRLKLSPRQKAIRAAEWRRGRQLVRLYERFERQKRKIEIQLLVRIDDAHKLPDIIVEPVDK